MLDTPTKALLSGAATVLILTAGVYLAKEYSAHSERSERAAGIDRARAELFDLAGAPDGDPERIRSLCLAVRSKSAAEPTSAFYAQLLHNCRALGYL